MTRFLLLITLTVSLFSCGGSGDAATQTASAAAPSSSDLQLNEKGRITSAVTLTLADGPFAGTYELGNEKSKGSVNFSAATTKHVKKHPKFTGTSNLTMLSMLTEDGFGILNMSRVFTGDPQTGHLPSMSWKGTNVPEERCGVTQLQVAEQPGIIRHVYVDFLGCSGINITGFGDEWKESKYTKKRRRPVAGKFSERIRIRDVNTTKDTKEVHETTMTIAFMGGQNVEL